MTNSPLHRRLSARRRRLRYATRRLLFVAAVSAVAASLVLADRLGVFGRRPVGEREKYHGQSFQVERVIDGDTIVLAVADGRHAATHVRLWGVDTPELENKRTGKRAGHFGPEASALTRRLCAGRTVTLEFEPNGRTRDKYDRLLAWVYLPDGRLLNQVLVEEGFGYADPRYDHHLKREFRRLQDQAVRDGRGLWEKVTEEDLPDYYKGKLKLPPR